MFNFLFVPDDKPGYAKLKSQVVEVFARIKAGKFDPYTSIYTTNELDDTTTEERRERMKQVILDYNVKFLEKTDEVERLAALYIAAKAIPESYPADAAHRLSRRRF
jgi:hypothetical protein